MYVNINIPSSILSYRSAAELTCSSDVHVSVCVCFQNGQTPLMLAAEQGSLEIVQELIRQGANVNLDDVVSRTSAPSVPVIVVILTRFRLWVRWLLGEVPVVSMVTLSLPLLQDCWSALISAAKEGHVDVVKELLENSAYIEHRDMVCKGLWEMKSDWPSLNEHNKILSVCVTDINVCVCVCQGGWTALTWAAYKGRVEVTKVLLEHGANPNTTGQVPPAHTHTQTHRRCSDVTEPPPLTAVQRVSHHLGRRTRTRRHRQAAAAE